MKSRQASSSSSIRPSLKRHSWQSSSSSVISSWSFNEQEPVQASEKTVVTRNKGPPKPDLSSLFMAKESPSLLAMDLASYVNESPLNSPISSPEQVSSYIDKLSLGPDSPDQRSNLPIQADQTPIKRTSPAIKTARVTSGFIPSPDRVETADKEGKAEGSQPRKKIVFEEGTKVIDQSQESPVRPKRARMPTPWPSTFNIGQKGESDGEEEDDIVTVDADANEEGQVF